MARSNLRVEQGIEIHEANGTLSSWLLRGTGAPPGTSGPTDDAPISSLWQDDSAGGALYHKIASTSSASDWEKFANQSAVDAISGGSNSDDDIAATTPTIVNTCLVDSCNGVEWEVQVFEQVDKTKREFFKITSLHDGTPSADATTFDETVHTKLKNSGADVAGLTFTTKLAGAAGTQTIGVEISATAAITVLTRRTDMPAD